VKLKRFLGVILDYDRAIAEFVELLRVKIRRTIARVPFREKYLCGTLDAGFAFGDVVDLAFPAFSKQFAYEVRLRDISRPDAGRESVKILRVHSCSARIHRMN